MSAVPQLARMADVHAVQLTQTGSYNLSLADLLAVARQANRVASDGTAGVVVTQGTDTLEETAFLLSLLNEGRAPFIVTGAMRNPTLPGADGAANLVAAVQVAATARRDLGTVVVFNDEIHDAWFVRKTHTSSTSTFSSAPGAGPLGWVVEDRIVLNHLPVPRPSIQLPADATLADVAVLTVSVGEDLRLLDQIPSCGYAGVVIEALGGGHLPERALERLQRASETLPVVIASRTGSGDLLRATYRSPGAEIDLRARNLLFAGQLDAPKARLLLAALLASDRADLGAAWDRFTE